MLCCDGTVRATLQCTGYGTVPGEDCTGVLGQSLWLIRECVFHGNADRTGDFRSIRRPSRDYKMVFYHRSVVCSAGGGNVPASVNQEYR